MPIVSSQLQKHFKLDMLDGLPSSTVTVKDVGRWLMCCPLCGCNHEVSAADETKPYTPICQSFPIVFKAAQVAWQKIHPEVAPYKTLRLLQSH